MAIHLDRQRPPTKKMGRQQRKGSKSNPTTGVQWANWLDDPAGAPGGGGSGGTLPVIASVTPATFLLSAADAGATMEIVGTGFAPDPALLQLDLAPEGQPAGYLNMSVTAATATSISAAFLAFSGVTAGAWSLRVQNYTTPGNGALGWSNPVPVTVTAGTADPTSSWTKAEIVAWLDDHGVDVANAESRFTKAELLDIVTAYLNGDPVDDLIGS